MVDLDCVSAELPNLHNDRLIMRKTLRWDEIELFCRSWAKSCTGRLLRVHCLPAAQLTMLVLEL